MMPTDEEIRMEAIEHKYLATIDSLFRQINQKLKEFKDSEYDEFAAYESVYAMKDMLIQPKGEDK